MQEFVQKEQGVCFRATHIKCCAAISGLVFQPSHALHAARASSAQSLSFPPVKMTRNRTLNTPYNAYGRAYSTLIFVRGYAWRVAVWW